MQLVPNDTGAQSTNGQITNNVRKSGRAQSPTTVVAVSFVGCQRSQRSKLTLCGRESFLASCQWQLHMSEIWESPIADSELLTIAAVSFVSCQKRQKIKTRIKIFWSTELYWKRSVYLRSGAPFILRWYCCNVTNATDRKRLFVQLLYIKLPYFDNV